MTIFHGYSEILPLSLFRLPRLAFDLINLSKNLNYSHCCKGQWSKLVKGLAARLSEFTMGVVKRQIICYESSNGKVRLEVLSYQIFC